MAVIKNLPASKTLIKQLEYLEHEGKTLEELKVGINCTKDNVLKEFYIVKEMYNKNKGKEYYHLVQAFSPEDDISPKKASAIGVEWIDECIKNHQIYVVTHIDKDHIHNHFVINSVNIDDGRKLQITPKKLYKMKECSNEICNKNNLSVIKIDNDNYFLSKSHNEYYMEKRLAENNLKTWKEYLREAIDISAYNSDTYGEFKKILIDNFNIQIYETKEKISYSDNNISKTISDRRLGKGYRRVDIIEKLYYKYY